MVGWCKEGHPATKKPCSNTPFMEEPVNPGFQETRFITLFMGAGASIPKGHGASSPPPIFPFPPLSPPALNAPFPAALCGASPVDWGLRVFAPEKF